jgi:hypothetical protein
LTVGSLGWLHLTVIRITAAKRTAESQPDLVRVPVSAEAV